MMVHLWILGFRAMLTTRGGLLRFNETFICGGGSKDIDPATGLPITKFSCVTDAVAFPGT
jgi:hypothetical protein